MALHKHNATAATLTRNRTTGSVSSLTGICATCIEGCPGLCEIGKSAYRGSELIYPQPFGQMHAAAEKAYPFDYSHFTIMGTAVGAHGIDADSDVAVFTNVNLETAVGADGGIKLKLPFVIPGLGSTDIAKNNWEALAIGAALTGTILTIGENVVGMDEDAEFVHGRIARTPELDRRVRLFNEWQRDGYGAIVLQANVEDGRLGVLEYGIARLGVEAVELKWGQGAKNIGGEVKITDLKKAQLLQKRGYLVLPDPSDPNVIQAFENGAFMEFERHSRVGMVNEEEFIARVAELRSAGAKYVFLKTGAYRPADLARAVKFASKAKIDMLTIDGAGGGTGMSPWRMMNEWGIPPLEIHSLTWRYADLLAQRGEYVPPIVLAGGFAFEDQIFKGLAMGAPYVKAIGMGRAPLVAAMVGKTVGLSLANGGTPSHLECYGDTVDEVFVTAARLRTELNGTFDSVPTGALGLYTYYQRLAQGIRQFMCGARKFDLTHISRDDIATLDRDVSDMTGIQYVMDADKNEVDAILTG